MLQIRGGGESYVRASVDIGVCACVLTARRWSREARASESHGIYRGMNELFGLAALNKKSLATPSIRLGLVENFIQAAQ